MIFYSLKDSSLHATLREVIMRPQATDGGLYMPLHIPRIPDALFRHLSGFTLHDIAYIVTNQLMGGDIDSATLQSIVNDTLSFQIPLRQIKPSMWSLELFHGPSGSFKDIGVRFLSRVMSHFRGDDNAVNLLVATAGPAVETIVRAFSNLDGVRVFLLYPSSRTNRIGFYHLGCNADNIVPVEVDGSFDDCHSMIESAFADEELSQHMTLSSANSLNIVRLLPQTLYYFWAYAQLMKHDTTASPLYLAVPSGNLGNLCAGVMAKKMGLPIDGFFAGENINCPFNRYLTSGQATNTATQPTLAGALDVGSPSNLQRLINLYNGSLEKMRADITGVVVDDDTITQTIKECFRDCDYLLDPHSAVAFRAVEDNLPRGATGVFLATSSPEKSRHTLTSILGRDPIVKPERQTSPSEIKPTRINATFPALKKILLTQ